MQRANWRFEVARGLTIPERDGRADVVCFFSVFTHLRHEETYLYLQEAKRVLKPTGKIIFSFLEFPNPHHWQVFENNMDSVAKDKPLNQFMSLDAIKIWAYHLEMQIVSLNRAGKVALSQEFQLEDGHVLKDSAMLGQSVCVISKRPQPLWRQKLNNALFRLADYLQRTQI